MSGLCAVVIEVRPALDVGGVAWLDPIGLALYVIGRELPAATRIIIPRSHLTAPQRTLVGFSCGSRHDLAPSNRTVEHSTPMLARVLLHLKPSNLIWTRAGYEICDGVARGGSWIGAHGNEPCIGPDC